MFKQSMYSNIYRTDNTVLQLITVMCSHLYVNHLSSQDKCFRTQEDLSSCKLFLSLKPGVVLCGGACIFHAYYPHPAYEGGTVIGVKI